MSAVQEQTNQHQFSAKGTRVAHVAEAPRRPVRGGMFGRLYNEKQSLWFPHSFVANTIFCSTDVAAVELV